MWIDGSTVKWINQTVDRSIYYALVSATGQVPKTLKSNAEKKTGSKVAI